MFTVFLPNEFDFTGGTEEDKLDIRYFALINDYSHYFDFHAEDSNKVIMEEYNRYKEEYTNEQLEVEATYGDIDWEGFQFINDDGEPCFVAHARKHKKSVLVKCNGYTLDGPTVKNMFDKLDIEKVNTSTMPDPARYDNVSE